ncbi:hypothetical protein D9M70_336930 [compost metagenome]
MHVALDRALPGELAVQIASRRVDLDEHRRHLDDARQRVQLAAGGEDLQLVAGAARLDRQVGVALACEVADAGEQAAGEFHAVAFQQLLAQCAEGFDVKQHHALAAEPDQTFLRVEVELVGEVLHVGEAQVGDDVDARRAVRRVADGMGHVRAYRSCCTYLIACDANSMPHPRYSAATARSAARGAANGARWRRTAHHFTKIHS